MTKQTKINVEVVYATPQKQILLSLQVQQGLEVGQVILESNIRKQAQEIDLNRNPVGIFGQTVKLNTVVKDGDRIEIYRPLIIDAKEARRQRAAQAASNS